ncbi:FlgD immunoglobulin-like domain containing protein [Asanoa iriomotensis]|nr:FlgD immunoglobulin-like domain containing protein [Asanoa iriomotensis]
MRKRVRALLAVALTAVVAAAVGAAVPATPAAASYSSAVTITVSEMHTTECLDRVWLVICDTPELFGVAIITQDDGQQQRCEMSLPAAGGTDITTPSTLCSGRTVTGNFRVNFELWEDDSTEGGSREQADLNSGPAKDWQTYTLFGGGGGTSTERTNGGPSWAIFTVSLTPRPANIGITSPSPFSAPREFDPRLGELLTIAGSLSVASALRFTITSQATNASFTLYQASFYGSIFNITWDGRWSDGSYAPLGLYTITVADPSDASSARTTQARVIQRVGLTLTNMTSQPSSGWQFRSGPITVNAVASATGTFRMVVSKVGVEVFRTPDQRRAAGQVQFSWNGRQADGTFLTPGSYTFPLQGTADDGRTFSPASITMPVVNPPAGLEVYALAEPGVPAVNPQAVPGTSIRAKVVATNHNSRPAARITIEMSPAGWVTRPVTLAARVVKTCFQVDECQAVIPSDILAAEAVAYRITATEAEGVPDMLTATADWRITDLNPPEPSQGPEVTLIPLWRASVPAAVDKDGRINTRPLNTTLDVAYAPGTGYDTSTTTGARQFGNAVDDNAWQLLGLGGAIFPSSIATHWSQVGIWVQNVPVEVTVSPDGDALCRRGPFGPVSFAEANGILHTVNCRDNASGNIFTADSPTVGWHEFHHDAYHEGDEYCCDGGYWYGAAINTYGSQALCQREGSVASTCNEITDGTTRTGWWRSDAPMSDVMIDNTVERTDDLRAAENAYAKCGRAQC